MLNLKITIVLFVVIISSSLAQDTLKFTDLKRYDHKIDSFEEKAKAENKKILLYFSGDGCRPCERMKKEVFTDKSVVEAYDNVILLNTHLIMKPYPMPSKIHRKVNKYHIKLRREFETENEYPTFCLFSPDGDLIAKRNSMTVEEFISFAQME
ncbi:thioredoxin family protein [Ekhidna sp.]|uniref:thioredoxin family protein n=1 Tax=Ekhidna sp. TaxID=2608089 RepID=UPI003C7B2DF9